MRLQYRLFRLLSSLVALLLSADASTARAQTPDRLPDIDVLYIERTPRYPGYQPDYDLPGRKGVPTLIDSRTRKPLTTAQAAAIKRQPAAGEKVTFTAHVQNRGAADAPPYECAWLIDGREIGHGMTTGLQPPGTEVTASVQWAWKPGRHTVRFIADPLFKVRDQSLHNNSREDATDAWTLIWAVDRVTYDSFNKLRNFLGTRSFEDWAQWHIDRMNHLFAISSSPVEQKDGWRPRVRCDRVVVVDNVEGAWDRVLGQGVAPLAAGYDGAWSFGRRPDCTEWAANADWGLIHEWGHQLGLTDEYALDRPGYLNEVADESGDPLLIAHKSSMAGYMMHGHGPTTFSPLCMAALISQRDRRRGFYGDYYFAIPARNVLRILDRTGKAVPGAKLTFWQDTDSAYHGKPIFSGMTDIRGNFQLPNLAAPEVTTDRGFTQHANPFGQINVVGPGDVYFIRIEGRGQTEYSWLDIAEMNLAWFRGRKDIKDVAVYTRRTRIPSPGAPKPPAHLSATTRQDNVTLSWNAVPAAVSYRVYTALPDEYQYRVSASLPASARTCTLKMTGGALHRFAVTAVDAQGRESAMTRPAGAMRFLRPWGIAVRPDGKRYIRDAAYGQAVLQKPDGSTVGLVGSVHYHFEGSFDLALDKEGRLLSAKWGDGYDPNPGFRVQDRDLNLVVDYRKEEGSEPGRFRKPMGIAADSRGHIFVADSGNDRIQEFTPDGRFVQTIGAGDLFQPMKPAFDSRGRLYVADSTKNRVAIFERQPDDTWKLTGALSGRIKEPCYIAIDAQDRVFVSTNRVAGIYAYGPDGKQFWEYHGEPGKPLAGPRGLAFDGRGNLLIVDDALRTVWSVPLPK